MIIEFYSRCFVLYMKTKITNQIKKLIPVLDKYKLIESFYRARQHYDEPKFWFYSTTISDKYLKHDGKNFHSTASGVSFFSQETAILKSIVEAIERYSNFAFFKECINYSGSYTNIKNKAIDPKDFVFFSADQLLQKKYEQYLINDNSFFRWTEFKSLNDNKSYYVPCQAVYLAYKQTRKEPLIYPSISTGTAGHVDIDSALLSGIYEVLERDAYMIYYLNKLKPKKYDLKSFKNKEINTLLDISNRYNLKLISLDIRTNIDVPVVASLVVDRSGLGKAVSIGLKSHLNLEEAIIGSINEAFHTRTWIREAYISNPNKITKSKLIKDSSLKNRGLFWYPLESLEKIGFLMNNLDKAKIDNKKNKLSVKEQISILKNSLNSKGYKIYYKDITSKYFKDIPLKIVKVIIPGMQPVYLDEKYPLKGGQRLKSVPGYLGYNTKRNINTYPHPFL